MLTPAQLQSQLLRAQSLHQAGRFAEAWALMPPLRKAIDHNGQGLRLFAMIAHAAGEIDPAVDALRRIIVMERAPPEIVGALADMLGNAGRHDEALTLWTQLTILLPDVADAHLNRAVSAIDAGKLDLALGAAEEGLRRFPGDGRLMATAAVALKNAGRIEESVARFEQAVAADPNQALTRHNQAVALRALCRFDEACEAFSASGKLGMKGAQFHANWAAAALEGGQIEQAMEQYQQALADDPTHIESMVALTRLQVEYRGGQDAFAHYERNATNLNRQSDWVAYANALMAHHHYAQTAEVARRGIGQFGEQPDLVAIEAYASGMDGDAGVALRRLETFFQTHDGAPLASMTMLAFRAGEARKAAAWTERMVEHFPNDQGTWMLASIAWRLVGDPREEWLCNYDRLVMVTDVPSADGTVGPADFAHGVELALDPLHQTLAAPGDQSLRDGTQTSGDLFERRDPAIRGLRDAVRLAAERVVATLPDDPTHPFLSRKSAALSIVGSWSVRLRGGGGHHVSHYHQNGWMSSAYYARLPSATSATRAGHEGWIQFGVPPAIYGLDLPPRRLVEPEVGKLVLFPSFMLHGTVPFHAGDRLTAAFDYQPN